MTSSIQIQAVAATAATAIAAVHAGQLAENSNTTLVAYLSRFFLRTASADTMAGTTNDFQNGAPFYLDATQQDLLLAALASNNQNPDDLFSVGMENKRTMSVPQYPYSVDGLDPAYLTSPSQVTPATGYSDLGTEESPFVGMPDGDASLDFDKTQGDLMIGSLPGATPGDSHEKRKNPDDEDDEGEDEGGGKRREGDDKQAKKPGRKPLTSEPTTVSIAQRACTPIQLTSSSLEA